MTTQNEEARRVRSYLLAQGENYAFTEMWPRLMKARLEVIAAVDSVSQEQADFTTDPDEWSIAEVLHHLITSSARGRRNCRVARSWESACHARN